MPYKQSRCCQLASNRILYNCILSELTAQFQTRIELWKTKRLNPVVTVIKRVLLIHQKQLCDVAGKNIVNYRVIVFQPLLFTHKYMFILKSKCFLLVATKGIFV